MLILSFNLFSDRDIFNLPFGQKLFAKIISSRRAPKVAEEYKLIGGKSPINEWTEIQRKMLEEKLQSYDSNISVFTAMRYWNPITKDVAEKIKSQNLLKNILLWKTGRVYPVSQIQDVLRVVQGGRVVSKLY